MVLREWTEGGGDVCVLGGENERPRRAEERCIFERGLPRDEGLYLQGLG